MHLLIAAALIWKLISLKSDSSITSTIHAIVTTILASFNLYNSNYDMSLIQNIMCGYFIQDLTNNLNKEFMFHHIVGIYVVHNFKSVLDSSQLLNKLVLVEVSTPFLNEYIRTKHPIYGILLLITFFIFRVIWLTYLFNEYRRHLNIYFNILFILFNILNYFWFYKIIRKARRDIRKKYDHIDG